MTFEYLETVHKDYEFFNVESDSKLNHIIIFGEKGTVYIIEHLNKGGLNKGGGNYYEISQRKITREEKRSILKLKKEKEEALDKAWEELDNVGKEAQEEEEDNGI